MPQTLNTHHSSHFNAFFPVKINKMWNFCLKFLIFQDPLIVETQNLHHWIWHASNPKYALLKPISMHFSLVKINKMWFFWLFASLPLTLITWKNVNLYREKVYKKAWKSAHICFLSMPITMHYVRTLSDKYFLSYDGFSWFLTGRLRHRVQKHSVGGRIRSKEDCCIGPILFRWFLTPFSCYLSSKIWIFRKQLIIETWNLHHWFWKVSNPKYAPLKSFQCIFPSQNQQNMNFLPEILIFQNLLIVETWKLLPLDLVCLKP